MIERVNAVSHEKGRCTGIQVKTEVGWFHVRTYRKRFGRKWYDCFEWEGRQYRILNSDHPNRVLFEEVVE